MGNGFREASLLGKRYRLERVLGTGGMATVWLAQDERLRRPVAVKILSDTLAADESYLHRFHREARLAASLSHPNLVIALAYYAPEAEWHTSGKFADQRIYRGHAGIERLWTELEEDIEELNLSVSDIRAVGDKVLVAGTMRGRGKQSKAGFEQPWWYVVTFRDGLTVRVEAYVDPTPALEAAGLSE